MFNELVRRRSEIGYFKTADGLEVDFLACYRGAGEELIQVWANLQTQDIVEREVRALEAAAKEYPRARELILVLDRDGVGEVKHVPRIEVLPAYEWLLAEPAQ